MNKAALVGFIAILPFMAGCGLSPDGWREGLAKENNANLCIAAIDDRLSSNEARRQAALDEIKKRKISCDFKTAKRNLEIYEENLKKEACNYAKSKNSDFMYRLSKALPSPDGLYHPDGSEEGQTMLALGQCPE